MATPSSVDSVAWTYLREHPESISKTRQNYDWDALRWYDLNNGRIKRDSKLEQILKDDILGLSFPYRKTMYERLISWSNQLIRTGNVKEIMGFTEEGKQFRELGDYVMAAADYFRKDFIIKPKLIFRVVNGNSNTESVPPYERQRSSPDDPRRQRFKVLEGGKAKKLGKVIPPSHPLYFLSSSFPLIS